MPSRTRPPFLRSLERAPRVRARNQDLALVGLAVLSLALVSVSASGHPAGLSAAGAGATATGAQPSVAPLSPGWSMFHADPTLSGSTSSTILPHLQVLWQETLPVGASGSGASPPQSSPVATGNLVSVVVGNTLYSLASASGLITTTSVLPGGAGGGPVNATPLLLPGATVGAQYGGTHDLFWVTAAGVVGVCPLGGQPVAASPTAVPGVVFIADTSGAIWEITPGSTPGCPTKTWASVGAGASFIGTPAIGYPGGTPTIYLPDAGGSRIDAYQGFAAAKGTPLPGFPVTLLGHPLPGSMSLLNLSHGSFVGPVGFVGDNAGRGLPSHLFALNLSSGAILATLTLPRPAPLATAAISATPALDPGGTSSSAQVYLASQDGVLSCVRFTLDASGGSFSWLWNLTGAGPFYASPAVSNGVIVDGDGAGWFYAADASSGRLMWRGHLGTAFYASPAINGNEVYALSSNGTVTALTPASLPLTLQLPPTVVGGSSVPVHVQARSLDLNGMVATGLAGANVTLRPSGGTIVPAWAITNATGDASLVWTAPNATSTAVNYTVRATASAPGYLPGSASGTTMVPVAGPSPPMLSAVVTPNATSINAGQTAWVNVTVKSGSNPLPGAVVVLVGVPAIGNVTPSSATTGSMGRASFSFKAPGNLSKTVYVTLTATARNGSQSATGVALLALVVPPPGTGTPGPSSGSGTQPSTEILWALASLSLAISAVALAFFFLPARRRNDRKPSAGGGSNPVGGGSVPVDRKLVAAGSGLPGASLLRGVWYEGPPERAIPSPAPSPSPPVFSSASPRPSTSRDAPVVKPEPMWSESGLTPSASQPASPPGISAELGSTVTSELLAKSRAPSRDRSPRASRSSPEREAAPGPGSSRSPRSSAEPGRRRKPAPSLDGSQTDHRGDEPST